MTGTCLAETRTDVNPHAPRPERPDDAPAIATLLDRAFENHARESRLWELLRGTSIYAEASTYVVERDGHIRAAALAIPRVVRLRGAPIACAAIGPVAVDPADQGQGLGRQVLETILADVRRAADAILTIGPPRFFAPLGFERAFAQTRITYRLPLEDPVGLTWRGIRGEDLSTCRSFFARCHASVSGAEERTLEALDWDSPHELVHTVCLEHEGTLRGYVRFRAGERLLVKETAVREERDWAGLLGFLARLGQEHQRNVVELDLPRSHPLHRMLLRLGGQALTHDLGGSMRMLVPDPSRLLARLFSTPDERLRGFSGTRLQLRIGSHTVNLVVRSSNLRVEARPARQATPVVLCEKRWPGLVTGLEETEDALLEPLPRREHHLLRTLFPSYAAQWMLAPYYDVCEFES